MKQTAEDRKEATMTVLELRKSLPVKEGERAKSVKDVFAMDGISKNGNIRFSKFGFEQKPDTKLYNMSTRVLADMKRGCLFVTRGKKDPEGAGYTSEVVAALYPHKKGNVVFFSDWRDGKKGIYSADIRGVEAKEITDQLLEANAAYLEKITSDVDKAKPVATEPVATPAPSAPRRRMK